MYRTVIASIAIATGAFGQAVAAESTMWVRVEVSMDGIRKSELESCLLKKLRGLDNLIITNKQQAPAITMVVLETKPAKGFAASYLFTSSILDNMLSDDIKKYDTTLEHARSFVTVESHHLTITGDLNSLCKKVAADYDVEVVEPFRRISSMMNGTKR